MVRRSTPQKKIDEMAFPVRVRFAVPDRGFGMRLDAIHAWLKTEVGMGFGDLMLVHKDADAIYMPFDIRTKLGAPKGGPLDFSITPEGRYGKLYWYLQTPDPAVHIPAWITLIALMLSIVGLFIGVWSVLDQFN